MGPTRPVSGPRLPLEPSLAYEPGGKLAIELRNGVVEGIRALPPSPSLPAVSSSALRVADPSGAPRTVPSTTLDALRIAGEKAIYPDPGTKKAIAALGNPRLNGTFKVCITALGTIGGVTMLKSTGSIHYDRRIERMIYAWRYRPFLVDGEPTPVCTAVTFIYVQQ
jgi:protein TonB